MTGEIAVSVNNVSKGFIVNAELRDNIKEEIFHFFKRLFTRNEQKEEDVFWALKDISFNLKKGETLGIIGANGAGKSTILKILSGIYLPTSGEIEIYGKVASILEVGTGFHPDLTGRENIYLNGELMGMTKEEVNSKFDKIVEFSGISKFIETPVKYYSSGMYIRLAFSIIVFLEADIMIFDEVIAVGDAEFSLLCKRKIEELKNKGKTMIIASHNLNDLFNYCDRTIWIENGTIHSDGETGKEIIHYMEDVLLEKKKANSSIGIINEELVSLVTTERWKNTDAPGNENIRLHSFSIQSNGKISEGTFLSNEDIEITIVHNVLTENAEEGFAIALRDMRTNPVFASSTIGQERENSHTVKGLYSEVCIIPANLLNQGVFALDIFLIGKDIYWKLPVKCYFRIVLPETKNKDLFLMFPGPVKPKLKWNTELISR